MLSYERVGAGSNPIDCDQSAVLDPALQRVIESDQEQYRVQQDNVRRLQQTSGTSFDFEAY